MESFLKWKGFALRTFPQTFSKYAKYIKCKGTYIYRFLFVSLQSCITEENAVRSN